MSIRKYGSIFVFIIYMLASAFSSSISATPAATNSVETAKHVLEGLSEYKPVVVWQAMPKKYQSDINILIRSLITVIEKENYTNLVGVLKRLVSVLKNKRTLITATLSKRMSRQQSKRLDQSYKLGVDFLDAYVNSDFGDYDKASKIDLEKVLATMGHFLMKTSVESNEDTIKKFNNFTNTKIRLLKSEKGREELEFIDPASKRVEKKKFIQVDRRWVPEDMATDWDKTIVRYKSRLSIVLENSKIINEKIVKILPVLEKYITAIENSNSGEEIIRALDAFKMDIAFQMSNSEMKARKEKSKQTEKSFAKPKKPLE